MHLLYIVYLSLATSLVACEKIDITVRFWPPNGLIADAPACTTLEQQAPEYFANGFFADCEHFFMENQTDPNDIEQIFFLTMDPEKLPELNLTSYSYDSILWYVNGLLKGSEPGCVTSVEDGLQTNVFAYFTPVYEPREKFILVGPVSENICEKVVNQSYPVAKFSVGECSLVEESQAPVTNETLGKYSLKVVPAEPVDGVPQQKDYHVYFLNELNSASGECKFNGYYENNDDFDFDRDTIALTVRLWPGTGLIADAPACTTLEQQAPEYFDNGLFSNCQYVPLENKTDLNDIEQIFYLDMDTTKLPESTWATVPYDFLLWYVNTLLKGPQPGCISAVEDIMQTDFLSYFTEDYTRGNTFILVGPVSENICEKVVNQSYPTAKFTVTDCSLQSQTVFPVNNQTLGQYYLSVVPTNDTVQQKDYHIYFLNELNVASGQCLFNGYYKSENIIDDIELEELMADLDEVNDDNDPTIPPAEDEVTAMETTLP